MPYAAATTPMSGSSPNHMRKINALANNARRNVTDAARRGWVGLLRRIGHHLTVSAAVTSRTCSGYCREIVGVLIELNAWVT